MRSDGEFVDANPIANAIVVNIGRGLLCRFSTYMFDTADMLQRWSNDILKSTMHRVVAPTKEIPGEYPGVL